MRAPSSSTTPLGRYRARVPLSYVQAFRSRFGGDAQRLMLEDLKKRARKQGPVLLVMQDPSDASLVTILAQGGVTQSDVIQVVGAEPVEDPPSWPLGAISFSASDTEPGMLEDEARAVELALRVERNPRHLEGFAHTCDPYLPIAASLLRQRASVLEPGADVRADVRAASAEEAKRARTLLKETGLPPDLTNLEIKRAACALANGEDTSDTPMGILHVASKTLTRTHIKLAEGRAIRGSGVQPQHDREPVYVIDASAMLAAAPPTGEEAFVSATAAQLALSATKPKISGVAKFERARSLFAELQQGNVPPEDRMQLLLARAMLEKARSAIERRRWVEWYRKHA